jgi:adenylate kinase
MKHPLVIIFLGPPGIGKGTQAAKVSEQLGFPHISTGDILRDNIKRQTQLGKQTQELIETGRYVPDDIINKMIENRVAQEDCSGGYILDGFPRTLHQAEWLNAFLEGKAQVKVICYNASDDTIVERLSGRLTCKGCGKTYHKLFSPPLEDNRCDSCSGDLIQRKDDQESVIRQRLAVYQKETSPLVDFYQKRGLLETVFCECSIDKIFEETLKRIKN